MECLPKKGGHQSYRRLKPQSWGNYRGQRGRHFLHKFLTQHPAATIATAELLTVSLKIEFVPVASRNRRYRFHPEAEQEQEDLAIFPISPTSLIPFTLNWGLSSYGPVCGFPYSASCKLCWGSGTSYLVCWRKIQERMKVSSLPFQKIKPILGQAPKDWKSRESITSVQYCLMWGWVEHSPRGKPLRD